MMCKDKILQTMNENPEQLFSLQELTDIAGQAFRTVQRTVSILKKQGKIQAIAGKTKRGTIKMLYGINTTANSLEEVARLQAEIREKMEELTEHVHQLEKKKIIEQLELQLGNPDEPEIKEASK